MKKTICYFLLLLASSISFAQTDNRIAKGTTTLFSVEQIYMPTVKNQTLQEAELNRRQDNTAPRFAESFVQNISPKTHGNWEVLQNGKAVWRLRISSPTAHSLNFGFTNYQMPESGTLVIYDTNCQKIIGPFSKADNEEHEQLWTPIIQSDDVILEVQLNDYSLHQQLELNLQYVNHDFIGFGRMAASGACNLDVICGLTDMWPQVDPYRDIIQSVAVISTGGQTFCTGFLINNTNQDCTPYFMTADHCEINSSNAASLVSYWNFENSYCRQPGTAESGQNGDGVLTDFNTGAFFRAAYTPTDMVLLELDDPVSESAAAFFAGWNRDTIPPEKAIAIHHPSTDEKRISFENATCTITSYGNSDINPNGTHIRVEDWDIGTTEIGSSGSPLFDQDKRVVGQLNGGLAACGNNDPDWYGWFAKSWEGGGTPSTRLKDWLDPDNLNLLFLDGRYDSNCTVFQEYVYDTITICNDQDFNYSINFSDQFLSNISLHVEGIADSLYSFSDEQPISGGSTLFSIDVPNTSVGSYEIEITGSDGTNEQKTILAFTILEMELETPTILMPMDMSTVMSSSPTFSWINNSPQLLYDIEIATDPFFNTMVLDTAGLVSSAHIFLLGNTTSTYYWRLRSYNHCDTSLWSSIYSFITPTIECFPYASTDSIRIDSAANLIYTSTISVTDSFPITDINIHLIGQHSNTADLIISASSPIGTSVKLLHENCSMAGDFDMIFDNEGETIICPLDDASIIQPIGNLTQFNGENPFGDWTLTVIDTSNTNGGLIETWKIDLCIATEKDYNVIINPNPVDVCLGDTAHYTIEVGSDFNFSGVNLYAVGLVQGDTIHFENNPISSGGQTDVQISGNLQEGEHLFYLIAEDIFSTITTPVNINVIGSNSLNLSNILPADESIELPLMPTFSWDSLYDAQSYTLQIATDSLFNNLISTESFEDNWYTSSVILNPLTTYYWNVEITNICGYSSTSSTNQFTTIGGFGFSANPASIEICNSQDAVFDLVVGTGFSSNGVMINIVDFPAGANINFSSNPTLPGSSVQTTITNLFTTNETNYTVILEATDGFFQATTAVELTLLQAPTVPTLIAPINKAVSQELNPSLTWEAADYTTDYLIEIALEETFNEIIETTITSLTNHTISTPLNEGTEYFWRVVSNNSCGSAGSFIYSFKTLGTSSITSFEKETAIFLFPNPTTGIIELTFSDQQHLFEQVELFNIHGQLLMRQALSLPNNNHKLNLASFGKGIYLFKISSPNKVLTQKVIVQ